MVRVGNSKINYLNDQSNLNGEKHLKQHLSAYG